MGQSFLRFVSSVARSLGVQGWIIVILFGVAGASMLATTIAHRETRQAREQVRMAGLELENVRAAADYTKEIAGTYRRTAEQLELERDSLAQALDERPVVRVPVTVDPVRVVDTLRIVSESPDSVSFEYEDALLEASVTVDLNPIRGALSYDVRPISLLFDARCGAPNEFGVRPVVTSVTPSPQLPTTIALGRVDPGVCNAPSVTPATGWREKAKWGVGGALVVAAIYELFR